MKKYIIYQEHMLPQTIILHSRINVAEEKKNNIFWLVLFYLTLDKPLLL